MIDRERWLEAVAVHWMHSPDDPRGFVGRGLQTNRPAAGDAVPFHIMRRVCHVLVSLADAGDAVEGLNQRVLAREVRASQPAVGTALRVLADVGFVDIYRAPCQWPRLPNTYTLTMPAACCDKARVKAAA